MAGTGKMSVIRPTIITRKKLKENQNLRTLLMSTKRYYEAFSNSYVKFYDNWVKAKDAFSDPIYKEGYDRVAKVLTDIVKPEERIVDIGCGVGTWSTLLAKNGAYVIGLDNVLKMLQCCKWHARDFKVDSRINTILADGFHLPFQAQTLDGATLNWVIAHIPVSRNIEFFREVSRVIKEKGWLVISDSYWREQEGVKEQVQVRDTDEGSYEIYKYYYKPEELQKLINAVFGSVEHLETTHYELICVARRANIKTV